MIILLLLLLPLLFALLLGVFRCDKWAEKIVFLGAVCHAVLCGLLPFYGKALHLTGSIVLSADKGFVILGVTSMLFLLTSFHLCFWVPLDARANGGHYGMSRSVFGASLLLFLFTIMR